MPEEGNRIKTPQPQIQTEAPEREQTPAEIEIPKNVKKWINQLGLEPFFNQLTQKFQNIEQTQKTHEIAIAKLITILQQKNIIPQTEQQAQAPLPPRVPEREPNSSTPKNQQAAPAPQPQPQTTTDPMALISQLAPAFLTQQPEYPDWIKDYMQKSLNLNLMQQQSTIDLNTVTKKWIEAKLLGELPK